MISKITSLYEVQFPIYVSSIDSRTITNITVENNIKSFCIGEDSIAYDLITQEYSTYLGRLIVLNRLLDSQVVEFNYSFINLAHLIYARPTFQTNRLIIDNLGQLKSINAIYGKAICSQYSHKLGNYIFTRITSTPIQIPQFPLLLDSLETYRPYIELALYQNTYFFKNILMGPRRNKKPWKIRIM